MGVTRSVVVLALVAMAAAGVARGSDWVGDRFGWRYHDALQSTVDGGKHWRTMAALGATEPLYAHLGPQSGFVFPPDEDGDALAYWTVDDGAHWYRGSGIGAPYVGSDGPQDEFDMEGTAARAFYAWGWWGGGPPSFGIYQVTPWPPRPESLRCAHWTRGARLRGHVCLHPAAPLRGVRIPDTSGPSPDGLRPVPGGIAALVLTNAPGEAYARVYIRRYGRSTLTTLPVDDATLA